MLVVQQPSAPAASAPAPQSERTVVSHRSANTGAIAAMAIGVVVLLGGMALILSQIRFLPSPYSVRVILGFGLVLLLIGASMISRGTGTS
jgi:hypothetical protein